MNKKTRSFFKDRVLFFTFSDDYSESKTYPDPLVLTHSVTIVRFKLIFKFKVFIFVYIIILKSLLFNFTNVQQVLLSHKYFI